MSVHPSFDKLCQHLIFSLKPFAQGRFRAVTIQKPQSLSPSFDFSLDSEMFGNRKFVRQYALGKKIPGIYRLKSNFRLHVVSQTRSIARFPLRFALRFHEAISTTEFNEA